MNFFKERLSECLRRHPRLHHLQVRPLGTAINTFAIDMMYEAVHFEHTNSFDYVAGICENFHLCTPLVITCNKCNLVALF